MTMKSNYIQTIVLAWWLTLTINAQVGINTNNPQGIFHIDTRNNNAQTGIPTAAEMTDDVVVAVGTRGGMLISVGGKSPTNSSAQLALLDPNKALLFNRVALTGLRDIVTIPNPVAGTIVYNTATNGVFPDNIIPGYYYFNGVVWYKWQYGEINSQLSGIDLKTDCYSTGINGLSGAASATPAVFVEEIVIKEQGTYIFSLRLYGQPTNVTGSYPAIFDRMVYYLFLMKNGSTEVNSAVFNIPSFNAGEGTTHTITMQAVLAQGDVVSFRLGHNLGTPGWKLQAKTGLVANKTSLIYWKI